MKAPFTVAALAVILAVETPAAAPVTDADTGSDAFERLIRPLFLSNCGECHGAGIGRSEPAAGFRLDSGSAFKANDRKAIRRLSVVLKSGPETGRNRAHHHVTESEFKAIRDWVSDGAVWPPDAPSGPDELNNLWALKPLSVATPPPVDDPEWNSHPIDRFIYSALERDGLSPSSPASPSTLIRRVYLDLLGLQPSADEVEKLESSWDDQTFIRLVDGLLSRPGYGERWGRHWLDVARYSDAKGYVDAGEPKNAFAWTYRDYVIRSFNQDLPFDRFLREQIAADIYFDRSDPSSRDRVSLAALGFLTVGHRFNLFPDEILDDRIDVITRGFLGMTASCARCHDHKYDPISTENYYSLFGILRNSGEPTPEQWPVIDSAGVSQQQLREMQERANGTAAKYHKLRKNLHHRIGEEMRRWAGDYLEYIAESDPNHRTLDQPPVRTDRGLIRVKSAYAAGGVIRWRNFLDQVPDSDPLFGLWKRTWALRKDEIADRIAAVVDDCERQGHNEYLISRVRASLGKISSMGDVARIYGDVFLSVCTMADDLERSESTQDPVPLSPAMQQIHDFLYGPECPGTFSLEESEDLYTLNESTEVRSHRAGIEREFLKEWDSVASRAMMVRDASGEHMVTQRVYRRGNRHTPGQVVPHAIPAIFNGGQEVPVREGSGRYELAEALASPQNPLTARVIVNRIWAWHFGQGLVSTPSDFGSRSDPPSHPELLDYLARWFIENGWSLKKLHRLILSSATWQQQSSFREQPYQTDPGNRLLWRMNRRRLDFESMRDSMLAVSGLLDRSMGGVPVMKSPVDTTHNRRTVYTFIDRENLADIFRVFDFPSPDISAAERQTTNVPQQALFLINSPFPIHVADTIADRIIHGSRTISEAHFESLFRTVLLRDPSENELEQCMQYISGHDGKAAGIRAVFSEIAQALLVSSEFLFVD